MNLKKKMDGFLALNLTHIMVPSLFCVKGKKGGLPGTQLRIFKNLKIKGAWVA